MKDRYPNLFEKYGDMLTINELAEYLSVSLSTAYRLIRERKIKGKRVGREWRIPTARVAEYLEQ